MTLRDMNDAPLVSDHDLLIRLDVKLDQFITGQIDHEGRLRIVEGQHDEMKGSIRALKGVVVLLGLIVTIAGVAISWASL